MPPELTVLNLNPLLQSEPIMNIQSEPIMKLNRNIIVALLSANQLFLNRIAKQQKDVIVH